MLVEEAVKASKIHPKPKFKEQYENFIGGKWTPPVKGQYFENFSPVDGSFISRVARSTKEDIDLALDAAHKAFPKWS
ncbi:MAG: aldehyde dehydrogenase, partial [[Chlorobium] sp. 445]